MRTRIGRRLALVACVGLVGTGCTSMRVTGAVSDSATGRPIPGAAVAADGRQPYVFTDLLGHYNLKAPWRTCAIVAFAPCYLMRSETVEPGQNRYPTKDLALERDPECGGRRWADPEPPDRRAPTR